MPEAVLLLSPTCQINLERRLLATDFSASCGKGVLLSAALNDAEGPSGTVDANPKPNRVQDDAQSYQTLHSSLLENSRHHLPTFTVDALGIV